MEAMEALEVSRPRRSRELSMIGVLTGIAAAAAVFAVVVSIDRDEPRPAPVETARAVAQETARLEQPTAARPLLVSGSCPELSARMNAGEGYRTGDTLSAEHCRVVVGFGGAKVELEQGSEIRFDQVTEQAVRFHLERGAVLAVVEPGRYRDGFEVTTVDGRVAVTGTVFEVRTAADGTRFRVRRGAVRVESASGGTRAVLPGQMCAVTVSGSSVVESAWEAEIEQRLQVLDWLVEDDSNAVLAVHGEPSGASVYLDGISVGSTSIAVSARPGDRELRLELPGHSTIVEHIALVRGSPVARTFSLEPVADSTGAEPLVARAGRGSRGETARATRRGRSAPDPAELLNDAQVRRKAREWAQASAAYEELLERYPRSPEARAARVSLGIIQLRHLGRPAAALSNFEGYLASTGTGVLAREALYWKSRALRELRRSSEERACLIEYLESFPGSVRSAEVKERLDVLR